MSVIKKEKLTRLRSLYYSYYSIVIALAILVFGIVAINKEYEGHKQFYLQLMANRATRTAYHVDARLEETETLLRVLVNSINADYYRGHQQEVYDLLDQNYRDYPKYENIFITDREGSVLHATNTKLKNLSVSDREYFLQAMENGDVAISDAINSKVSGQPVVAVAIPYGKDKREGIIGAVIVLEQLSKELSSLYAGTNMEVMVVDAQGKPLTGTGSGITGLTRAFNEEEPQSFRQSNGVHAINGESKTLYVDTIIPSTEWGVLVFYPVKAVIRELFRSVAPWVIFLNTIFIAMLLTSLAANRRHQGQKLELTQAYQRLERIAYIDVLTGIYNHRFFQEAVEHKLAQKLPFTLMLVDINHFRFYNDSFGMEAGDQLLKAMVRIVRYIIPDGTIVSRYGADQFAVIFTEHDDYEVLKIAHEIREAIKAKKFPGIESMIGGQVTVSTGIARYPSNGHSREELIRSLEQALHESKDTLSNIKVYFSALQSLRRSLDKSESELYTSMRTLMGIIHAKDKYTMGHTERVVALSTALAKRLELDEEEIKTIRYGAYLHDIGKIEIDYFTLNKKGPLTAEERERIHAHPGVGAEIIRSIHSLENVIPIILHHHEHFNGSGYPDGLAGEEIPLHARIVTIADCYDAMTSQRSYKTPMTTNEALEEFRAGAGTQFDPHLVEVFLQIDFTQVAV